jgi:hypothetical protein
MRTPGTQAKQNWDNLCYPSDRSDAEWQYLHWFFRRPRRPAGIAAWPTRELINAMFSLVRNTTNDARLARMLSSLDQVCPQGLI